jgi:hypothetical protein
MLCLSESIRHDEPCVQRLLHTVDQAQTLTQLILDVHFVNPSPVFCLDKAGDCGHPKTMNLSVLPAPRQGSLPCQYLMLPQ